MLIFKFRIGSIVLDLVSLSLPFKLSPKESCMKKYVPDTVVRKHWTRHAHLQMITFLVNSFLNDSLKRIKFALILHARQPCTELYSLISNPPTMFYVFCLCQRVTTAYLWRNFQSLRHVFPWLRLFLPRSSAGLEPRLLLSFWVAHQLSGCTGPARSGFLAGASHRFWKNMLIH